MSDAIITPENWKGTGWILLNEKIDPYGVVGVAGELTVAKLKAAYRLGIFPWPQEGQLYWFCPPQRGVLEFSELHIPNRFMREWKQTKYDYTINQNFSDVIKECAEAKRRNQSGTWITEDILQAYCDLHHKGLAKSFEVWENGKLIGGLYGVKSEKVFAGESAFGMKSNVAKHALLWCIQNLIQEGSSWMDIQMVTPLTEQFGGKYIPRTQFLSRI
jgi:leucyl/phenylalanyl-tRNA--protein transferase